MFQKILLLNFEESNLQPEFWRRIDKITKQKVLLKADSPEVKKHLSTTDCLLLKHGMIADKTLIDSMPNLKYIGILATAYGRIDTAYAKKKGITVCNVPGYATEGVAEFVFAALLEHLRKISPAKLQAKQGNYLETAFMGTEIRGKTFGVLGLGRIGRRVAYLALDGFKGNVSYWSHLRKVDAEKHGIRYMEANKVIQTSQILSLHMVYNPATEKFFDSKRIQLVKPGTIIINTAPMELFDIDALEKRLKKADITFILDHSDELSPQDAKRLSQYKNCILYPPIGLMTEEATRLKQEILVSNLENFLKGEPTNKVN